MADRLCVVRGGGDLGTGVVWRLTRAGLPVIVCELPVPLAIRRAAAVSTAVTDGTVDVEGMIARRVDDPAEAQRVAAGGEVAVLVAPALARFPAAALIDARMAKRNIDTTIDDAPLVVALGPGFTAGVDCHAVVETARGHHLGRVLWDGAAAPDTGTPGTIGGRGVERIVRAPTAGPVEWDHEIGDTVAEGAPLGHVGDSPVPARTGGVIRGLVADGGVVAAGQKIGDIDPRADTPVDEISDKALAVGGGVLEAVLVGLAR